MAYKADLAVKGTPMFMVRINRVRDFGPQGVSAPVGFTRGMRWRWPVDRLWLYPGEDRS